MTLHEVAFDLYGLPPEDFTEQRNARAKRARADGDRELGERIRGLRKPRSLAWMLNMLVRRERDDVERLMELGAAMRAAQVGLDGERLRELDVQRRDLTTALTDRARSIGVDAGHEPSDALLAEVANTLRAAMADPAGAAALCSGLLLDGFGASVFEPLDVRTVVAVPDAVSVPEEASDAEPYVPPAPRRAPATKPAKRPSRRPARTAPTKQPATRRADDPARRARQAAEALEQARGDLVAAEDTARRAEHGLAEVTATREALEAERATLQGRLRDLDRELTAAHRAEDRAERERDATVRRRADAARAVRQAQKRAERLG